MAIAADLAALYNRHRAKMGEIGIDNKDDDFMFGYLYGRSQAFEDMRQLLNFNATDIIEEEYDEQKRRKEIR